MKRFEIVSLYFKEESSKYLFFRLELDIIPLIGDVKRVSLDCAKEKDFTQSFCLKTSESLFLRFSNIDESINAILDSESRSY